MGSQAWLSCRENDPLDTGSLAGLRMYLCRCCPSEGADGATAPVGHVSLGRGAGGPDQQGDGGVPQPRFAVRRTMRADRRGAPHLGQGIGQDLPLVGGVGIEPGIEAGRQVPAGGGREQQEQT